MIDYNLNKIKMNFKVNNANLQQKIPLPLENNIGLSKLLNRLALPDIHSHRSTT